MKPVLIFGCLAGVLLVSNAAIAQRVRVQVTDISGGRAYLTPGSEAGLQQGTTVRFGRRHYTVVASTSSYAVIVLGSDRLSLRARGIARVSETPPDESQPPRLPAPTPLREFEGQWAAPTVPALTQQPDFVPLGHGRRDARYRVDLRSSTVALVPFGDGPMLLATQLRGRVNVQPFTHVPLRLSADAALQVFFGGTRRANASRPILVARQLQLSYGSDGSFYAAIGRLQRASSAVGMLDGARVQSPRFSGLQISAFGGAVPEPAAGIPTLSAARFGVEVSYRDLEHAFRPSASVVAYGSTFDGALDERRLSAQVRLMPGTLMIGGQAELAFYDQDNPWNAPTAQLFRAGLDASGRHGGFRWGVRGDYRVPERSRWLASFLPDGYFCVAADSPEDPASITCASANSPRYLLSANGEFRGSRFAVGATASYLTAPGNETRQLVILAHGRVVDLLGFLRANISLSATRGSAMDAYSGRLAVGTSLLRGRLDFAISYRPTLRFYAADIKAGWDHRVGGRVFARLDDEWSGSLSWDALFGRDLKAMLFQLQLMWRPDLSSPPIDSTNSGSLEATP